MLFVVADEAAVLHEPAQGALDRLALAQPFEVRQHQLQQFNSSGLFGLALHRRSRQLCMLVLFDPRETQIHGLATRCKEGAGRTHFSN